jgi:hypothetical protein
MSAFVCPRCFDTSVVPTSCDRCGLEMLAESAPAPLVRSADPMWTGLAPFLALGPMFGVGLAAVWSLFHPHAEQTIWPYVIFGGLTLAGPILGLLARAYGRASTRRLERERARRFVATPIASAADGPVEIRGVARVLEPATAPRSGAACAAYVSVAGTTRPSPETHSGVGTFEVRDDSGAVAIVRAGPCVLDVELDGADEKIVEDGARVVVRGLARWVAADAADGGYREHGRRLELRSDLVSPMSLALDGGIAPTPPPRVRVAEDVVDGEPDSMEEPARRRDQIGGTGGSQPS